MVNAYIKRFEDRNRKIFHDWECGDKTAALMERHNLSRERIRQICHVEGWRQRQRVSLILSPPKT